MEVSIPGKRHVRFGSDVDRGSRLQRSRHLSRRPSLEDAAQEGGEVLARHAELLFNGPDRDQAAHEEGSSRLDAGSLRRSKLQSRSVLSCHELFGQILERLQNRQVSTSVVGSRLSDGRLEGSRTRTSPLRQAHRVLGLQPQPHGHYGKFRFPSFGYLKLSLVFIFIAP